MRKSMFSALALALALSVGFAGPRETPRQTAKRQTAKRRLLEDDKDTIEAAEAKRERRRQRNIKNNQG